jgi:hypothetical protein
MMIYNEEVSSYDQGIKFVVGFAGSGKSTDLARRANPSTLVLTPTHKAAGVLHSKQIQAFTIHSVLKLVPTLNENFRKGQRMQVLKQIGGVKLDQIKDVFIDEFSMINVSILDLLLSVLPPHCKVTVFGDPYQLPPVDGESIDPLMYTEDITELTKQHRAEAPEVVETFMRFMNYIRDGGEMNLTLNPAIKHGDLKGFNPATDRILAYTNAKVIELNNVVAKNRELPEYICVLEDCLVNDMLGVKRQLEFASQSIYPSCMSKGKLMEEGKLEEAAFKAERDIEKYRVDLSSYERVCVEIDGISYLIYSDTDHYANSKAMKQKVELFQHKVVQENNVPKDIKLADWCRQNPNGKYVRDRAKSWSTYLSHQNYVFNLRRPFATTIHKAQGSEFETVYIAQADIKRSIKKGYYDTYARLMYVALSRAIKKVVVV